MNKTTIISIIAVAVFFGGVVWVARPNPQNNTANVTVNAGKGMLKAEEINFDFGTISMANGIVKHVFKIKNEDSGPVTIKKMYSSCMCTTASLMIGNKQWGPYGMPGHGAIPKIDEVIGAGEEVVVEVAFDPAAHGPAGVGRIQRSITIENDGGQPLELGFTVLVTP